MAGDGPRANLAGCVEGAHAVEQNDPATIRAMIATTEDSKTARGVDASWGRTLDLTLEENGFTS